MKPPLSSPPSAFPRPGRYIRGQLCSPAFAVPRAAWVLARWWQAGTGQPLVPAYNLANLMQVRKYILRVHRTRKIQKSVGSSYDSPPPSQACPGLQRVGGLKEGLLCWLLSHVIFAFAFAFAISTTPFLMDVQIGPLLVRSGAYTRWASRPGGPSRPSFNPRVIRGPHALESRRHRALVRSVAQYPRPCTVYARENALVYWPAPFPVAHEPSDRLLLNSREPWSCIHLSGLAKQRSLTTLHHSVASTPGSRAAGTGRGSR